MRRDLPRFLNLVLSSRLVFISFRINVLPVLPSTADVPFKMPPPSLNLSSKSWKLMDLWTLSSSISLKIVPRSWFGRSGTQFSVGNLYVVCLTALMVLTSPGPPKPGGGGGAFPLVIPGGGGGIFAPFIHGGCGEKFLLEKAWKIMNFRVFSNFSNSTFLK